MFGVILGMIFSDETSGEFIIFSDLFLGVTSQYMTKFRAVFLICSWFKTEVTSRTNRSWNWFCDWSRLGCGGRLFSSLERSKKKKKIYVRVIIIYGETQSQFSCRSHGATTEQDLGGNFGRETSVSGKHSSLYPYSLSFSSFFPVFSNVWVWGRGIPPYPSFRTSYYSFEGWHDFSPTCITYYSFQSSKILKIQQLMRIHTELIFFIRKYPTTFV